VSAAELNSYLPGAERRLHLAAVLTIEETATVLRIGRTAAYDAARRGEIPTIRLGRSLRVPRALLLELLGEIDTA
jgi:excisionase family DNA binding protein